MVTHCNGYLQRDGGEVIHALTIQALTGPDGQPVIYVDEQADPEFAVVALELTRDQAHELGMALLAVGR